MAEGDGKTVLVTGGSGYLAGWCIVGLLERGYRVRTTVRNPGREHEVHAAVASQVGRDAHFTVHQADLLIIKSVSDPKPHKGDIITYTLRVGNTGPDAATGIPCNRITRSESGPPLTSPPIGRHSGAEPSLESTWSEAPA